MWSTKLLVIAIVLLLVIIGLPILVPGGASFCDGAQLGHSGGACGHATLAGPAAAMTFAAGALLWLHRSAMPLLLRTRRLERPPRRR